MSLAERCNCEASIEVGSHVPVEQAEEIISRWRESHLHSESATAKPPMGFNTTAVSGETVNGEGDSEWSGMWAGAGNE